MCLPGVRHSSILLVDVRWTSFATYILKKEDSQMTRTMINLKARLNEVRDEKGATAVEYVLIVGGIAAVIGIAVAAFGTELSNLFNNILP